MSRSLGDTRGRDLKPRHASIRQSTVGILVIRKIYKALSSSPLIGF